MSAPNEGRQSPEPERQTGDQLNTPSASGQTDAASSDRTNDTSDKEKVEGLSSNPTHPLAKAAEEKTSKS